METMWTKDFILSETDHPIFFSLGPVIQLEFVLVLIIASQCSQIDVLYSVSWSS